MSNEQSSSFTSYSSVSYTSSSSMDGEQVSGSRHMQTSHSDPSGTTVTSTSQNLGEPAVCEERNYDSQGRELISGGRDGGVENRRIEDVDEEQRRRDLEYEERIEDEYAKREGGA